jgi:protein SCO1/2
MELPTTVRLAAIAAVVVLLAAACGGSADPGQVDTVQGRVGYSRTPAPHVGDITMIDYSTNAAGETYAMQAETDELLLVYFGYLSCPDVCPTTLAAISVALDAMPPDLAANVEMAMISVDPERDEGVEIATYLDVFVERNHGLLAPDEATLTEAGDRFSAAWEIEDHEPGEVYFVAHSAVTYVVDDTGTVVWELPFGSEPEALAVALEAVFVEHYGSA